MLDLVHLECYSILGNSFFEVFSSGDVLRYSWVSSFSYSITDTVTESYNLLLCIKFKQNNSM